ncbi:unnamed protein product [Schistosoma mattheei]|uniref:Secreted protein n=2 Tax=Schistosoma TaxID=6181 RepID=A0A183KDP5_9TREM|nr:unnamed protein product [Schistosoma mattheei]VDP51452.1 unnamed protein product [Schistosoma curassoni]
MTVSRFFTVCTRSILYASGSSRHPASSCRSRPAFELLSHCKIVAAHRSSSK